ncbi:hypothetical protein [Paludisphaera rhizosphaerae]|nr:hypothetical protein [Paludisphaera rhizosphaerae]
MPCEIDWSVDAPARMPTLTTKQKAKPKRKKKRAPYLYTPADFDFADYGIGPKDESAARWLINCIYFNHVVGRYERHEYCPLNAKLLAKVMGDGVARIRKMCVEAGLVDCIERYKPKVESFKFRLGYVLRDRKFVRWSGDDQWYLNRFNAWKELLSAPDLGDLGNYLRAWAKKVKVDKTGLEETLAGMKPDKRELAEQQVGWLDQGVVRATWCKYGRFHTNFTRLCKEVRQKHLTINGERLFEIDIQESQTLFLGILLMNANAYLDSCSLHSSPSHRYQSSRHHPCENSSFRSLRSPYDLGSSDKYIAAVGQARVYDDFQRAFSIAERGDAKVEFFRAVYSGKLAKFRGVYPKAARVLAKLVRLHGYKWVSREMQWQESDVVLRKAVERLRVEHPDIPVVTVHDSIMTTQVHLETVYRVLSESFQGLPLRPRFRVDGEER